MDRRRLLLAGATVAGIGGLLGCTPKDRPTGPTNVWVPPSGPLAPVSMAMHLHGSFSEGQASMAAHLSQAERLGVDVVWWTDHDWRVAAYGHRREVHFDGPEELENGLWWRWTEEREGPLTGGGGEFVSDPHSPDEPGRALRLTSAGAGTLWYAASAWNYTYRANLGDTTLELDVLPEVASGFLTVEITLSHQPATGDRPAAQYELHYRVRPDGPAGRRAEGTRGIVEIGATHGAWQRLTLRPVDDVAALWPDLLAADNSLFRLRIGVTGDARYVVDRLRFARAGRAWERREELIRGYAERFAKVRQEPALEVSLVRHLNWFGGAVQLPDFGTRGPVLDSSLDATRGMVRFIHEHGGLASYNHPMQNDATDGRTLARHLIKERALGCDIVEIGYPAELSALLKVFDATARNALFFTGTGVTDDHAGLDWLDQPANYLTSVWATSTRTDDLLAALRAGHAWFVNPKLWRGELDLLWQGNSAMGGVLLDTPGRVDVGVVATELPKDGTLEVVVGRVDQAGPNKPEPAVLRTVVVPARDLAAGRTVVPVEPGGGAYVRAMVRTADGSVAGVGNPLWLLKREPPGGVPGTRRLTG